MTTEATNDRQQAHELIERLPPEQVTAVVSLLQFMLLDPASRALASAPLDDEAETDAERYAVEQSRAWFTREGKGIPHEEILREFGLK